MSPRAAVAYVEALELPEDEAYSVIECDIRRRSCVRVAEALNRSVDGIRKIRQRAYSKMANDEKKTVS